MTIDTRLLNYITNEESYPDKAVIIAEGSHNDGVYLIIEGRIKVKKKTPKGMLTLTTLEEGAVFGELIFLQMTKHPRTAAVVADGPVRVGLLNRELLDKEYHSVSPLLKELISTLARRVHDSTKQLVSMSLK